MHYPTLPDELTPINIKGYLYLNLGLEGTANTELYIKELLRILDWLETGIDADRTRCDYTMLFPSSTGLYYIMMGMMEKIDLIDFGGSIRYPWLNEKGSRFLIALQNTPIEDIDQAEGETYYGSYLD